MGIWRGAFNFYPKHLVGTIKIQWYSVWGGGGEALITYFNNRSGLKKYFNE